MAKGSRSDRRIQFVLGIFLLVFGGVIARAFYLQTVSAEELSLVANDQHVREFEIPARRGTIFDRGGNELAVGEETRTIFATPYQVTDPLDTARKLAPLLKKDEKEILAQLSDRQSGFVYLARKVDRQVAREIEEMNIPGLGFIAEEKRRYPQNSLAAQVIGFAGTDNHGLAGMELQLDEVLAGTGGKQTVITDASGNQIEMLSLEEGVRGADVWLTLDQSIQFETERVLSETVSKWSAKGAAAIVMDPHTGEIYAMANVPTFDANAFDRTSDEQRRNRTVTDNYEPGSVFKAVTVAAGLEEGAVIPGQTMHLEPTLELGGRTIKDAVDRGPVDWDLGEILVHSSNVGAVTVGMRTGDERLNAWLAAFGFGAPTGISFPGEAEGIMLPVDQWSGSTIGNVPIGQGISVTAVQMVSAYATIANGGVAVTPQLVSRVGGEAVPPPAGRRVIQEQTAAQLTDYLTQVVDKDGAPLARIDGYSVAGKTGTAQKPMPDGGGYSDENYIASFIGYLPAADPQLVVLVMVDEPHPFGGGATVAAPAFQKIASFSLQKLRIAP